MENTPGRQPTVEARVVAPASPGARILSDRKKLVRLLGTIVGNAFKFTAEGSVTASADVRGQRVFFRVTDTGIGIPPEARRVIFDEFRQVDGSATRRYGGSGLGLTLARQLARIMGGDIEVDSTPGAGSTFTIDLPLDQSGAGAHPAGA